MKNRMTLRLRISLIVAAAMLLVSASLTLFSVRSSNRNFVENEYIKVAATIVPSSEITAPHSIDTEAAPVSELSAVMVSQAAEKAQIIFTKEQLLAMFIICTAGAFFTYFLVGKALLPLSVLSRSAEKINASNLRTEITVPAANDELHSLACSFNSMLARLHESFEIQKNFAANAAHEFRTPLTTMKSSIQILRIDGTPTIQDYQENAAIMEENIERLIGIVDQLLATSSPDSMENTALHFNELIEDCMVSVLPDAEKKDIKMIRALEKALINSNSVLLRSIISNLLSNAIKFSPAGSTIRIRLSKQADTFVLIVSDEGVGISPDQLPHIFEPFYRGDKSRSKAIPGSGLGLQIVKTAVTKLGGTIEVKSTPGKGTTFTVSLPN